MSDMGDLFNDLRKVKQDKRRANLSSSTKLLIDSGVSFESKNDGIHLIVIGRYDFWPSTGKWIDRQNPNKKHRGVRSLLAEIK